jgi:hypothetical protein
MARIPTVTPDAFLSALGGLPKSSKNKRALILHLCLELNRTKGRLQKETHEICQGVCLVLSTGPVRELQVHGDEVVCA